MTGAEEAFKDFLRIMNRRNDALHGNIDPRKTTGEEIFFDLHTIPLPKAHQSFSELLLANAMANLTPDSALADVDTVHRFVEFLLSHLSPKAKVLVERAMQDQQLGFRPKTGTVGLILPSVQFEGFPVIDRTSSEEYPENQH